MDLNRALADHQIGLKMKEQEESEFKIILVAPANGELPNDGFLTYNLASDVKSLLAANDGDVLVIDQSANRILKMLIEYQDEFGCRVKVLEGLPNADYAPWFNSIVWSQDKISYSGLLSEMSIADEMKPARDESVYEKESKQYTRANGSVKSQDNFSMAGEDEESDGETFE